MKACQLALLADVDDADVARSLRTAAAAQPQADGFDAELFAIRFDQAADGNPFHTLAVRADGVQLKSLDQITYGFHTVHIYSYGGRAVKLEYDDPDLDLIW